MKAALGTFGELHKPTSKETQGQRGDRGNVLPIEAGKFTDRRVATPLE
jgi:hypothetical protein